MYASSCVLQKKKFSVQGTDEMELGFFSSKDLKLCFDSEYLHHIFHQFVSSVS